MNFKTQKIALYHSKYVTDEHKLQYIAKNLENSKNNYQHEMHIINWNAAYTLRNPESISKAMQYNDYNIQQGIADNPNLQSHHIHEIIGNKYKHSSNIHKESVKTLLSKNANLKKMNVHHFQRLKEKKLFTRSSFFSNDSYYQKIITSKLKELTSKNK